METFQCEYCEKEFTRYRNLQTHIKTAKYCLKLRGESLAAQYICDFCGTSFTQGSTLKMHSKSCSVIKLTGDDCTIASLKEDLTRVSREKSALLRKNRLMMVKVKKLEGTIDRLNTELGKKDDELEKVIIAHDDELEKLIVAHDKLLEKKDFTISKKNTKIANQKAKIAKQQEDIILLRERANKSEGIIIGIDKAKPQITNITNNIVRQKLAAIPIANIEPCTIELVHKNIHKYDYNAFLAGVRGITNYIKSITILEMDDGTIEQNYASTNRSRVNFHRLVEDKHWKQDGGARFIQEILSVLSKPASEHMDALAKNIAELPVRSNLKHYLLGLQNDLVSLERGLTYKDSKERADIFSQIRNEMKNSNCC